MATEGPRGYRSQWRSIRQHPDAAVNNEVDERIRLVEAARNQMRRLLPGVTAAATTAVFAIGDGPGLTAAVTTAAFATGAPMTPLVQYVLV